MTPDDAALIADYIAKRGTTLCPPLPASDISPYFKNTIKSIKARTRATKDGRGSEVKRVSVAGIFKRDGWICGICGERINPMVRYPAPLSGSLDHIKPLSEGGDHIPENCQAAHLACNMKKAGEDRRLVKRAASLSPRLQGAINPVSWAS